MEKKFYRKVLKNRMTVILEKRNLPIVSVSFAVRYGGVNESSKERGIAHFIEHMLYKGTKKRTYKQISKLIEKNGGVLDGFTDESLTAFWCKIPSTKLSVALNVLGDMVQNPKMDPKELNKERQVIFEEMKIYHDSPSHYVFDGIQECLYSKPLGEPLIGTPTTMNGLNRKDLMKKFIKVYKPNNMILCVVGDADFEEILKFAEKNFKGKTKKPKKQKIILKNGQKIETRKGIDQANMVFAFHSPLSKDPKIYAAKILITLMADGLSSRLFTEIREKRNMAYSVQGGMSTSKDFSYSYIYVGAMKKNIEKIKKLILEEFRKVSTNLTEKELKETKQQLIGNYDISLENSVNHNHNLLMAEVDGNAKTYYDFEKKIRAVKLKDVKNLAKIPLKKYSFFALAPE